MIREAQVFALASSYEGSPKALLEAMACGKAVVGADSPGIREVIQHGDNGLLAEPTPDGFEMALRRLLRDSELRRRLGPRARAYVMQNNSQAASALKEARLLRELIGMRDSEGTDDG
jgi:glycosyltransferase involved in cell wall biosynthesis